MGRLCASRGEDDRCAVLGDGVDGVGASLEHRRSAERFAVLAGVVDAGTTPRPLGVASRSRCSASTTSPQSSARVFVGADHAAGQGVEHDEPVAVPVDQRGQVADFGCVGEVHRARQHVEGAVVDGGVPAKLPGVHAPAEPERPLAATYSTRRCSVRLPCHGRPVATLSSPVLRDERLVGAPLAVEQGDGALVEHVVDQRFGFGQFAQRRAGE